MVNKKPLPDSGDGTRLCTLYWKRFNGRIWYECPCVKERNPELFIQNKS